MKSVIRIAAIIAVASSSVLTGCASIVNGTSQVLSVETRDKTQQIVGASCKLDNGKGVYFVTTPGTVTVHRAYDDMTVKCEKESISPGLAAVKSTTKAMAFGNIIFGGVIGAAIDAGSGAAYDYPTLISVIMGEASSVEPVPTNVPTAATSTPASSTDVAAPLAQK
jgi:hypothetical protein